MSSAASNPGPLLGRDAEVELLTSLLDGISSGGGVLVLYGEPGIGKSRLLAAAAAAARERGFTVVSATGVQSEAHLPFAGLHQLLRPLRFRVADLPAAQRAVLDTAFGLGQEPAPERFRIAMAVLDLLCEVAADAPLLVLAEDAQWLDRPTTEVLAFVARRLQSDPVVLLAAAREGYPSPLVDAGLPQHRLDGLAPAEARTLLDASGQQLSPAIRDRLLAEAAGNPLALKELPMAAARREPVATSRGAQPAPAASPAAARRGRTRLRARPARSDHADIARGRTPRSRSGPAGSRHLDRRSRPDAAAGRRRAGRVAARRRRAGGPGG
jgi:AAA ATPase domain